MEDIARSHPFQGYLMLIRYLYVNENLNFFQKGKKKRRGNHNKINGFKFGQSEGNKKQLQVGTSKEEK